MVPLAALWLPILLSAVFVFVASSIIHMLLPYHRSDYRQLPDEDKILSVLRAAALKRGLYVFPFCTHKDMKSPAIVEKQKQGPVGFMTILPVLSYYCVDDWWRARIKRPPRFHVSNSLGIIRGSLCCFPKSLSQFSSNCCFVSAICMSVRSAVSCRSRCGMPVSTVSNRHRWPRR